MVPAPEDARAFPVSRVAELLGRDRKTVREQFEPVRDAARDIVVAGQRSQGWAVEDMPTRVRSALERAARAQGCDSAERLLAHGNERWSPRVPLSRLPQKDYAQALRRRDALAPVLAEAWHRPVAEVVREAAASWTARGGHPVGERTLRRWIDRAITRDRGFRDWQRWEIYVDDDLVPEVPATRPPVAKDFSPLDKLRDALCVARPAEPTAEERERIWFRACDAWDMILAAGGDDATARRDILRELEAAGLPLAKNGNALRVALIRKRARWLAGEGRPSAIVDQRSQANRERAWQLPAEDQHAVLKVWSQYGGGLAPAWRRALREGLVSKETRERYAEAPRYKSQVPDAVREVLAPLIKQLEPYKIGPRAARQAGPYTPRDWSCDEPGDWWCGDDLTPPVYYWEDTPNGLYFGRGQLLMLTDCKTDFVLGWVLISARNYTGCAIRSLITVCHDAHGLPRVGFLFENGIWKESRVLTGERVDADTLPFEELETGLREFGCTFQHAKKPQQKPIERVFGLLQDRMEALPGYCGRDERRDCPERVRRHIAAVVEGRRHPSAYFMEKGQLMEALERIVADFNAEARDVRAIRTPGQSPREVYEARDTTQVVHLGEKGRYLLATHRLPVKVGRNGIRLRGSLGGGLYRNEHTAARIGEEVLAWVDLEHPESITITTKDRREPCLVDRVEAPRAVAAEAWELRDAVGSRQAHSSYSRNLFRVVNAGAGSAFRPLVMDRASVRLGRELQAQKHEAADRARKVARLDREFDRLTAARGLAIPRPIDAAKLADVVDGLRQGEAGWDEIERHAQEGIGL